MDEGITIWCDAKVDEEDHFVIAEECYVAEIIDLGDVHAVQLEPLASYAHVPSDAASILDILYDALANERPVALARNEEGRILDVEALGDTEELFEKVVDDIPIEPGPALPQGDAKDLFETLAAKSMTQRNRGKGTVPYLYPRDGCWGRAHAMFQDIQAAGLGCQKIWTYGSLRVRTANSPKCRVGWGWHVAVALEVEDLGRVVFDPSLFDEMVTVKEWLGIQRGWQRDTHLTAGSVFYRWRSGKVSYDRNFMKMEKVLSTYRGKLAKQARKYGWPPFAHCDV